jgi:hypothetical protein
MKLTVLLIFAIPFFWACEKESPITKKSNQEVMGYWVLPVYGDSLITFSRANSLQENGYGIAMLSDQVCIERKNAGWCGTPPITYADFEGSWSLQLPDSLIVISVPFWGGIAQYQWKILSIDNQNMEVYRLLEDYSVQ